MSVIAFDTLKFANRLKQAGVPDQQAEAQAVAFAEMLEVNLKELATREDLRLTREELRHDMKELEMRIEAKMERLDAKVDRLETRLIGELTLVKWMLGLLLGGVLALILKAFFPL